METNWKSPSIPEQQLNLNLRQLSDKRNYAPHWRHFLSLMKIIENKVDTLYDLGCGVGTMYKVTKDNSLNIKYVGIDFSESMIQLAKKTWNSEDFYVGDFRNVKEDFSSSVLYASGLLDILPDGLKELDTILNYGAKYIVLSRVEVSKKQIYTYTAYGIEITKYIFDQQEFLSKIAEKYRIIRQIENSYLLELLVRK